MDKAMEKNRMSSHGPRCMWALSNNKDVAVEQQSLVSFPVGAVIIEHPHDHNMGVNCTFWKRQSQAERGSNYERKSNDDNTG